MADADILLDLNTIEFVNGDVRITQGLEIDGAVSSNGTLQIKDTNGQVRIELREDGQIILKRSDGTNAVRIREFDIELYDTGGQISIEFQTSGSAGIYQDLLLFNGADIKLDGQFLAARLDDIEQRLANGGL